MAARSEPEVALSDANATTWMARPRGDRSDRADRLSENYSVRSGHRQRTGDGPSLRRRLDPASRHRRGQHRRAVGETVGWSGYHRRQRSGRGTGLHRPPRPRTDSRRHGDPGAGRRDHRARHGSRGVSGGQVVRLTHGPGPDQLRRDRWASAGSVLRLPWCRGSPWCHQPDGHHRAGPASRGGQSGGVAGADRIPRRRHPARPRRGRAGSGIRNQLLPRGERRGDHPALRRRGGARGAGLRPHSRLRARADSRGGGHRQGDRSRAAPGARRFEFVRRPAGGVDPARLGPGCRPGRDHRSVPLHRRLDPTRVRHVQPRLAAQSPARLRRPCLAVDRRAAHQGELRAATAVRGAGWSST